MTTNLFATANVKQLRTDDSFRILLPFFRTSWGVGVLNSAIFNNFHNHKCHRLTFISTSKIVEKYYLRSVLGNSGLPRSCGGGGGFNQFISHC